MSDRLPGNSGGAPTSSAPHASASESGAPPEEATLNDPSTPVEQPDPSAAAPAESAPASADAGPEPGSEPEENHEAKLEHDLEELAAKAQKADEYLVLAQRTKADFENYRKRAAREAAAAQERGVVKLVRELLPAVDNLDRAVAGIGSGGDGNELG